MMVPPCKSSGRRMGEHDAVVYVFWRRIGLRKSMVYCAAIGYRLFLCPVCYNRDRSVRQVSVLLICIIYTQNMETIDIPIPANHSQIAIPALIERAVSDAGLLADRLELHSYPGATHWHIRQPGAR